MASIYVDYNIYMEKRFDYMLVSGILREMITSKKHWLYQMRPGFREEKLYIYDEEVCAMVEDFVDLAKDINKQLCKYAEKQKNSQIRKMIEDVSFEISGFEDCSNNGAMRSFVIRSSNNNIECDVDYEDECDGFREYYSEEYEDYEEFVDSICEVVENIREFVDEKLFKETVTVELTGHGEAIIRNDNVYKEYSFIDGRIEEKKEIETTETIETLEKIEEPQEKVIKDDDSIAEFLKALGRPYDNEAVEKITIEDFMKCF